MAGQWQGLCTGAGKVKLPQRRPRQEPSLTAKVAKAAQEETSLTAKVAKAAEENESLTAKMAEGAKSQ